MDIVDQYYWLGYAKKEIDGTAQALTDAAAKVSTLVATFWGLYVGVFTIGVSLKKIDESREVLILLVLPIPLLIFSYMAALWAQMPELSLKGVDPRIPDDVMNFYNKNIRDKKRRLMASLIIFFASGLSLAYALVKANFTHDKKDVKQLINVLPTGDKLFLSGDVPTGTIVKYAVLVTGKAPAIGSTMVLSNDHFDRTLPAPVKAAYSVSLSWRDKSDTSIIHTFVKYFPLPKPPDKKTK
jgi:hypothetical protein